MDFSPKVKESGKTILDGQRVRVEKAISEMINDMYKTHLRKMQGKMHSCAATCCENVKQQPSMDSVQSCIENCASPLLKAQDFMQQELGQFQMRLQNCVMQCNESVRNQIPFKTHETDLARFRHQFENCTVQCVDKHINLIPTMMRTIKSVLASGPNSIRQA